MQSAEPQAGRLRAGDLVQAIVGAEIREVIEIESAGVALDEQAHRVIWPRGGASSTEQCALYATGAIWSGGDQ